MPVVGVPKVVPLCISTQSECGRVIHTTNMTRSAIELRKHTNEFIAAYNAYGLALASGLPMDVLFTKAEDVAEAYEAMCEDMLKVEEDKDSMLRFIFEAHGDAGRARALLHQAIEEELAEVDQLSTQQQQSTQQQ